MRTGSPHKAVPPVTSENAPFENTWGSRNGRCNEIGTAYRACALLEIQLAGPL